MIVELFLGSDGFRRGQALAARVADWLPEVDPIDFEEFDLRSPAQVGQAVTALRIGPLLGPARLVVWKGLEVLLKASGPLLGQLEEALPAAHPDLVLLAEGETKSTGKKAAGMVAGCRPMQLLVEGATTKTFDRPAPWDRPGQVDVVLELAAQAGLAVGRDRADELVDRLGTDSARLWMELQKLAVLEAQGQPITSGLIRRATQGDHADLGALHRAVVRGEGRKALALAEQVVAAGTKPAECVMALQREALATMLVAHTSGKDNEVVADWLRCSPGMLFHRRKEWAGIKKARAAEALAVVLQLAEVVEGGRPLSVRQLLQRYCVAAG